MDLLFFKVIMLRSAAFAFTLLVQDSLSKLGD